MVIVNPQKYHMWVIVATSMTLAELGLWLVRSSIRLVRFLMQFRGERRAALLRNKQFGFVFQFYYLLPELNVLENAMIPPMVEFSWLRFRTHRAQVRKRATEVLEQLGMSHRL